MSLHVLSLKAFATCSRNTHPFQGMVEGGLVLTVMEGSVSLYQNNHPLKQFAVIWELMRLFHQVTSVAVDAACGGVSKLALGDQQSY